MSVYTKRHGCRGPPGKEQKIDENILLSERIIYMIIITSNFKTDSIDAPEPLIYEGCNAVYSGLKSFDWTFDKLSSKDKDRVRWRDNCHYAIVVDPEPRKVYGIQDYGRYKLGPHDILFRSGLLPLNTDLVTDSRSLAEHVDRVITLYQEETEAMLYQSRFPLFLTKHCGGNNYIAWSLTEQTWIYLHDYDGYSDQFVDAEEYTVFLPSYILADELGLLNNLVSSGLYSYWKV